MQTVVGEGRVIVVYKIARGGGGVEVSRACCRRQGHGMAAEDVTREGSLVTAVMTERNSRGSEGAIQAEAPSGTRQCSESRAAAETGTAS